MLRRKHVNHVTPYAESAARKVLVIALVLHPNQPRNYVALAHLVTDPRDETHLRVILRGANSVYGADSGNDDGVAPLQHAFGR